MGSTDEPAPEPMSAAEHDAWMINVYKIFPCNKKSVHDWTSCPYSHPSEKARRRDPKIYNYLAIPCPEAKQDKPCGRGDSCPYSHSLFEFWLHPSRYKTQMCQHGSRCKRAVCFFAHTVSELRVPDPSHLKLSEADRAGAEEKGGGSSTGSTGTPLAAGRASAASMPISGGSAHASPALSTDSSEDRDQHGVGSPTAGRPHAEKPARRRRRKSQRESVLHGLMPMGGRRSSNGQVSVLSGVWPPADLHAYSGCMGPGCGGRCGCGALCMGPLGAISSTEQLLPSMVPAGAQYVYQELRQLGVEGYPAVGGQLGVGSLPMAGQAELRALSPMAGEMLTSPQMVAVAAAPANPKQLVLNAAGGPYWPATSSPTDATVAMRSSTGGGALLSPTAGLAAQLAGQQLGGLQAAVPAGAALPAGVPAAATMPGQPAGAYGMAAQYARAAAAQQANVAAAQAALHYREAQYQLAQAEFEMQQALQTRLRANQMAVAAAASMPAATQPMQGAFMGPSAAAHEMLPSAAGMAQLTGGFAGHVSMAPQGPADQQALLGALLEQQVRQQLMAGCP